MKSQLLALTSLSMLVSLPAAANPETHQSKWSGYAGAGVLAIQEYEGAEDMQAVPLLAVRAQYNQYYIETRGLGARANVSTFKGVEFGPSFRFRMTRDDDIDNDRISRLREVDSTFEVGAFVRFPANGVFNNTDELAFEVDVVTDVSDTHDGTVVSFGPSYSYSPARKLRLSTSVSATYATENFNDTYYTIDANNAARSGLTQYDADGGINDVGFTFTANYQLNDGWGIVGLAGYRNIIGDAADSPIVDDEGTTHQFMGGAGVTYRF